MSNFDYNRKNQTNRGGRFPTVADQQIKKPSGNGFELNPQYNNNNNTKGLNRDAREFVPIINAGASLNPSAPSFVPGFGSLRGGESAGHQTDAAGHRLDANASEFVPSFNKKPTQDVTQKKSLMGSMNAEAKEFHPGGGMPLPAPYPYPPQMYPPPIFMGPRPVPPPLGIMPPGVYPSPYAIPISPRYDPSPEQAAFNHYNRNPNHSFPSAVKPSLSHNPVTLSPEPKIVPLVNANEANRHEINHPEQRTVTSSNVEEKSPVTENEEQQETDEGINTEEPNGEDTTHEPQEEVTEENVVSEENHETNDKEENNTENTDNTENVEETEENNEEDKDNIEGEKEENKEEEKVEEEKEEVKEEDKEHKEADKEEDKEEEIGENKEEDNSEAGITPHETTIGDLESPKKHKSIKYDDGSYNPQGGNQSGKKMYSKDFLLQFKDLFIERPQEMTQVAELVPSSDAEIKPKKPTGNTPRRGQPASLTNRSRGSLTNSRGGKPTKTRKPVLKLDNEDEIVYKIQSILNKLTPNTYDKLFEQLKDIDLSIESNMNIFIKIIFPKAVTEQRYCELYAKLCSDIVKTFKDNQEHVKLFRKLLLSCCQQEFENKPQVPEIPADASEVQKIELEEKATKVRLHNLGNIKFIGELYKLHMLRESIMFYCIESLIKSKTETDLEHMCLLVTTIGKILDQGQGIANMNRYFEQIRSLATTDNAIIARIRYMLMDLIDLRAKKWVPRREVEGPKTIKEVHDDTEKKEREKQLKSKEREREQEYSNRNIKLNRGLGQNPKSESPRGKLVTTIITKSKGVETLKDSSQKEQWQISTRGRGRGNPTSGRSNTKNEGDSTNKFALLTETIESPKPSKPKGKPITVTEPESPAPPPAPKVYSDDEVAEKNKECFN